MTVISLEAARERRQRPRRAPEECRAEAALNGFDAGRLPFTEVLQALVAPFQDPAASERARLASTVEGWAPAAFRRRSSPA